MNPKLRKQSRRAAHQPWEKLQPAVNAVGQHEVTHAGETFKIYKNALYTVLVKQVTMRANFPAMTHLSVRRNDRQPIFDWRDMQRVKNDLIGEENEGVQLFPAESRLLDTSNQYHMYVINDPKISFPFGYEERHVSEQSFHGSAQRRFADKPDDLLSDEEFDKRVQEYTGSIKTT
jgi:hypothetical protein